MLRALRLFRARRGYRPPAAATHVLTWTPGWLIEGGEPAGGSWAIESVASFLAGDSTILDATVGPAGMYEADLGDFAYEALGSVCRMDRFEVEITDEAVSRAEMVPCYWLTPPLSVQVRF